MKVFGIFTIITMVLTITAYGESEKALEKVALKIEGMAAQCCALIVKDTLLKVNGVKKASVSFEDSEAVVEFEFDKVTIEQLVEVVKEIGYTASIKEVGKSHEMSKEIKKEIENKFRELSKRYKIPEEDLEEHWSFVKKEVEKVFERCCEWALSQGMEMEDAKNYCKSAVFAAIGEYSLAK